MTDADKTTVTEDVAATIYTPTTIAEMNDNGGWTKNQQPCGGGAPRPMRGAGDRA